MFWHPEHLQGRRRPAERRPQDQDRGRPLRAGRGLHDAAAVSLVLSVSVGAEAPPSVLPDISPARGEIGGFCGGSYLPALTIGETLGEIQSPPLRGRCQVLVKRAGQRGVLRASAGA
ncbi:hypothetical protein BQ8794_140121 [Mesorhizobium prunaredense]|uniref:Uncharacterized protein n=1 Tax=Mesorhizobium prunaredense TaxID=1631249 RepID=A0A1R3V5E1_9HYPH|nr:hypothetical protein BQ8794_140121 [Mesorhizobium prunaredense]